MSQRREKYARAMERRVAVLEDRVDRIGSDMSAQEERLTTAEGVLEFMSMPSYVVDADWGPSGHTAEARRVERRDDRRKRTARRRVCALCLALLAVVLLAVVTARAAAGPETTAAAVSASGEVAVAVTVIPSPPVVPEPWTGEGEDPLEAEKIEAALLEQGYFSDAVPLTYDMQDYMRTACEAYGCPYPLALAVAETESRFDHDAVGAVGEVGIMQLNPGPGGAYHAELEAATGQDPATPAGNIVCGVYLLGKYMSAYEDPAMAAMAYNMGEAGAREAWAAGMVSTGYSTAVLEAMERWEDLVDPWDGI